MLWFFILLSQDFHVSCVWSKPWQLSQFSMSMWFKFQEESHKTMMDKKCLPWLWGPDSIFPLVGIDTEASDQRSYECFGFSCFYNRVLVLMCPTKIMAMTVISVWFKFQEESHETMLGTFLTGPAFGTGTDASNQMNAFFFHALVTWFSWAWPKKCQPLSIIKIWFKFQEEWHARHISYLAGNNVSCFLCLIVELMPQSDKCFFSIYHHRVHYGCFYYWHPSLRS